MDDTELANALAANLDGAFESLVRAYQQRLFAFALRMTGSRRDAEEIAQDAFVRAYRALATYPGGRIRALQLRAWLFQIAVNLARNLMRRHRPAEMPLDGPDETRAAIAERLADPSDGPETRAEQRDADARVAELLGSIPERYRTAVILRHVHGISYQEIGTILGQPAGTVKSNVHRGVGLLRDLLNDAERPGPGIGTSVPEPTRRRDTVDTGVVT